MKKSLSIAYAMKKKSKKPNIEVKPHPQDIEADPNVVENLKKRLKNMADGGPVLPGASDAQASMRKAFKFADGGEVEDKPLLSGPRPKPSPASDNPFENLARTPVDPKHLAEAARSTHLAKGGEVYDVSSPYKLLHEQVKPGFVPDEPQYDWIEGLRDGRNVAASHEDSKKLNQHHPDMQASTSMSEEDLVDRIMAQREKSFSGLDRFSKGGQVANDTGTGEEADKLPNQFDDLVLDDELTSTYGDDDNSGDNLGNAQEDEDRKDIVARIMASRRKKDRLPNPA